MRATTTGCYWNSFGITNITQDFPGSLWKWSRKCCHVSLTVWGFSGTWPCWSRIKHALPVPLKKVNKNCYFTSWHSNSKLCRHSPKMREWNERPTLGCCTHHAGMALEWVLFSFFKRNVRTFSGNFLLRQQPSQKHDNSAFIESQKRNTPPNCLQFAQICEVVNKIR